MEAVTRKGEWPDGTLIIAVSQQQRNAKQVLIFRHVKWAKGKPETAEIECEHCAAMHSDAQRLRMVQDGEWKQVKFYSAGSTSEGLGPSVSFRR